MPEEIKITDLAVELKGKLRKITNLKTVYVGRKYVQDPKNYYEQESPKKKHQLAFGKPEIIQEGIEYLIRFLNKDNNQYEVRPAPVTDSTCNMLYVVLEIDTANNYCMEDLDDDEIIVGLPFTLVK